MGRGGKNEILLNDRQYDLIEALVSLGGTTASILASKVGKRKEDIMRDLMELQVKGLIRIEKVERRTVKLSDEGRKALTEGLPEERLLKILAGRSGELILNDLRSASGMDKKEFSAALGRLRRFGAIEIRGGKVIVNETSKLQEYIRQLKEGLRKMSSTPGMAETELGDVGKELRRRGLAELVVEKQILVKPTETLKEALRDGRVRRAIVVTKLTPELIASGGWREAIIKEFDLSIEFPSRRVGRPHPYVYFLNYVRELVMSLGFEEVKGPHIELALWNFDSLFVPQYHPSRKETDVYYVKNRLSVEVDEKLLNSVGEVHRDVLKYRWHPSEALRLVLR
ncbi:MAG: hypothetical protein J7L55_05015, partial [Desulfurococcales archaeon]|nr:hypothetical protein [Desulfurococcales archaeon]